MVSRGVGAALRTGIGAARPTLLAEGGSAEEDAGRFGQPRQLAASRLSLSRRLPVRARVSPPSSARSPRQPTGILPSSPSWTSTRHLRMALHRLGDGLPAQLLGPGRGFVLPPGLEREFPAQLVERGES